MSYFIRAILIVLSVAVGVTFLYSAYTKVVPIQSFEYTMVEYVRLPALVAAIGARFFVGLEAALGGLLILHFLGKRKWVVKLAIAVLLFFSGYLIWLWIVAGNDVNCGCFGDKIWMSPSASLLKNTFLVAALLVILRFHNGWSYKWVESVTVTLLLCTFTLPYIVFPIEARYRIDFTALYANDIAFTPTVNLNKGKHIVAFLSPSCIHCRKAGLKMHELLKQNPQLPFYMVVGGTMSDISDFWRESQAADIPYTRLAVEPFMKYTHGVFPAILWINNGIVEANTNYKELDIKVIEKWMK